MVDRERPDVLVCDDGMQHYRLARDMEIALIDGTVRFRNGLPLPAGLPAGRKVVLGVRPDDLRPDNGTELLSGSVTVREPLGPETLIYVNTEAGEVIARADGRHPPEVGATVSLGAAQEDLHFFDADSGVALR